MIFGAVLAGGIGTRMQMKDMPKQFLPLGDKPVIIHTLQTMLSCQRMDVVFIGTHSDWIDYMEELVAQYLPGSVSRVRVVNGGSDRNETIQNIIRAIEAEFGVSDEHIIVTHDAVRPFATLRMIEENIDMAIQYGAVDTVVPAIDTIVVSSDGQVISDIPDRKRMYQGQTPQSFRIHILKDLYASLTEEEKSILTDACKICLVRNWPVYLVEGSYSNMKITTQEDYKIARAMEAM